MPPVIDRPLAIALMGPTASGKTDLAVALSQRLPCDIISVDSAQVYRGMDIGSAKPEPELLRRAPHRLIDIADPREPYSAARFRTDALAAMSESLAAGRVPLLVGGTMLYFKALLYGIDALPPADAAVRAAIAAQAASEGWEAVHRRLAAVDAVAAARIRPTDAQRLQRALEVYLVSGRSLTAWQQQDAPDQRSAGAPLAGDLPCPVLPLALAPLERSVLHARIAERFRRMVAAGLIDEVRRLVEMPDLDPELPALRAVGYRQVLAHLRGELSREDMIERGIIATRQLAKRQLTWLRSWHGLRWMLTDADGRQLLQPRLVAGLTPLDAAIYYLRIYLS